MRAVTCLVAASMVARAEDPSGTVVALAAGGRTEPARQIATRWAGGPWASGRRRVPWWAGSPRGPRACGVLALLHPEQEQRVPFVTQKLQDAPGPVVAVSDDMRAVQDQIAQWVPGDFISLGADGFGFSDTRAAARRYFHIDGPSVVVRALQMLAKRGEIDASVAREAAEKYHLLDVAAGASGNAGGES